MDDDTGHSHKMQTIRCHHKISLWWERSEWSIKFMSKFLKQTLCKHFLAVPFVSGQLFPLDLQKRIAHIFISVTDDHKFDGLK
jgi:hypothetical protein